MTIREPSNSRPACRRIACGSPDYEAALALRDEVLRKPLGLRFTEAQLRAEAADHHLAAFLGGRLVACLILTPQGEGIARMRQVAVAADLQRRGVGTALVRWAETYAAARGYSAITAHARDTAVPFYKRLGYAAEGARFVEVGIPHIAVRKTIGPPKARGGDSPDAAAGQGARMP